MKPLGKRTENIVLSDFTTLTAHSRSMDPSVSTVGFTETLAQIGELPGNYPVEEERTRPCPMGGRAVRNEVLSQLNRGVGRTGNETSNPQKAVNRIRT